MKTEFNDEQINQMTADAREHLVAFKSEFTKMASNAMSSIVAEYLPFIETDAWANYRQYLKSMVEREYMENAHQARLSDQVWARDIRSRIYNENKEELTQGLVADLKEEIAELKEQLNQRRW